MFPLDPDPAHDRPFAEVAPRLAEWQALQGLRPSAIERAWQRAGFALVYGPDLARHHAYDVEGRGIALLPAWAATAHPVYRNIILLDVARRWEEEGRHHLLDALGVALAALASEEDRDHAA